MTRPPPSGQTAPQSLRLEQVSKAYAGVPAVQPMTLEIAKGELLALLGPSGCGKTTTLRMVAGFEMPDTGSVLIGGRDVTELAPEHRGIGMVFQSYALFPHMTVGENLAFGLRMQRLPRAEIASRVVAILETVRLGGFANRYASQLSGGQQQRVALARSIVTNPAILLLDEPLGALDKNLREGMQFELHQLQRSLGITSVLVTHDQEEALTMADRVAVMSAGRILQIGPPTEVYNRPRNRFVAEFLGTANIFAARRDGAGCVLEVGSAKLPCPLAAPGAREKFLVAIRPESVRFTPPGSGGVAMRVVGHVFRGSYHAFELAAEGLETRVFAYRAAAEGWETALVEGDPVEVSWHDGAVVPLDDEA